MKTGIHPEDYRLCVFRDMSTDYMILTKSCAPSEETIKYTDGNEYPLIKMEISSDSHPFFVGCGDSFPLGTVCLPVFW